MVFLGDDSMVEQKNQILFPLKSGPLIVDEVIWIGNLPVLFPMGNNNAWFRFDDNGNLVFEHDILQSAFYLLSAQQEVDSLSKDEWGRYLFKGSVQDKLGIVLKPIVNYYFSIILSGLQEFSTRNGIEFSATKPFDNFAYTLSHDIDRLYFHHPREVAGRLLQLLGLRKHVYPLKKLAGIMADDFISVWRYKQKDEWNNFDLLIKLANENNIKSTFYFLPKTKNRYDSRYQFSDKQISKILCGLNEQGFEVGFHVPLDKNFDKQKSTKLLKTITSSRLAVRRHYLAIDYPQSYIDDGQEGVLYDSSFGFSEQEGFRNSYCLPFRPYDHRHEKMVETWVIPLVAMDVTMLLKKNMTLSQIDKVVDQLTDEAASFGGVFSLLWHNCRFDEINFPGITRWFGELLGKAETKKAQGIPGREIIAKMERMADYSSFIIDLNNGFISKE